MDSKSWLRVLRARRVEQYKLPYTIVGRQLCRNREGRALNAPTISRVSKARDEHVLPDIVLKILQDQIPSHLGEGNQVRTTPTARRRVRNTHGLESERALNNDFNISTAKSTNVLELRAGLEEAKPGKKFSYVSDPPFPYDVQMRVPDVTKARECWASSDRRPRRSPR